MQERNAARETGAADDEEHARRGRPMTKRWIGPGVIGGMLVFTALAYSSLPDRIPTHWNVSGEADGWSSRVWGSLLAPVIAGALWVLLPVLRRVDPRRRNYDRFDATFWLIVNLLIVFMGAMHVLTLGVALGWAIDMTRAILVVVGLMFMGLGNYLPRLRSNWWMGIRTPWTLESESVWRSTHRLAGYTFVIAGLVAVVSALLPTKLALGMAMAAMLTGALVPAVYSYIAYRREREAG
jgi:uncharacterized membrane protein